MKTEKLAVAGFRISHLTPKVTCNIPAFRVRKRVSSYEMTGHTPITRTARMDATLEAEGTWCMDESGKVILSKTALSTAERTLKYDPQKQRLVFERSKAIAKSRIVVFDLGNTLERDGELLDGALKTLEAIREIQSDESNEIRLEMALLSDWPLPDSEEELQLLKNEYYQLLTTLQIREILRARYNARHSFF